MKFPEEVRSVIRDADAGNPSDLEQAVDEAERKIRSLMSFDSLVSDLVRSAIQGLIYDMRHAANGKIRYESGNYKQDTKTVVGTSDAVMRAESSVYQYRIAGTSLGQLLGKDLIDLATGEENRAEGYIFNARLLRRLSDVVPQNKMVKNAITQKKLKAIFFELQTSQGERKQRGGLGDEGVEDEANNAEAALYNRAIGSLKPISVVPGF